MAVVAAQACDPRCEVLFGRADGLHGLLSRARATRVASGDDRYVCMPLKGVVVFEDAPHRRGCVCAKSELPALEDVANRPIAHHVLDALLAVDIVEIVVVGTGDALIEVQESLRRYSPQPARLDYAVCGDHFGLGDALRAAAPLIGSSACVVHVADGLLGETLVPYIRTVSEGPTDLAVLAAGDEHVNLHSLGAKSTPNDLGGAGVGVFGPGAVMQVVEMESQAPGSGFDLVVDQLRGQGGRVEICAAEGWRRNSGKPEDLLDLNRLALDGLRLQLGPVNGRANQVEGRVHIHPTAEVIASVIIGPVVVAAGASIANSYIGPYTSIGAEAKIEGAEIERSIISPGAKVMHVGGRLVSSLVGRDARVFKDFSVPRAMRLRVSAGDEVALG